MLMAAACKHGTDIVSIKLNAVGLEADKITTESSWP